jgi:hypothetical protein
MSAIDRIVAGTMAAALAVTEARLKKERRQLERATERIAEIDDLLAAIAKEQEVLGPRRAQPEPPVEPGDGSEGGEPDTRPGNSFPRNPRD